MGPASIRLGGPSTPGQRRFEKKVVLVTGASSGIGLATALAFAREGARVAIIACREKEGARAIRRVQRLGAEGIFIAADVTDRAQVRDAFAKIAKSFRRLDSAVNNAGVQQSNGGVAHVDEAEFDRIMQTNVKGTWYCLCEEVAMMEKRGGAIVNMSSIRAHLPGASFGVYAASKAAVVTLSGSAAMDYVNRGIRVNVLCPGNLPSPSRGGILRQ